jgi:GT2 family glycosyltransferase
LTIEENWSRITGIEKNEFITLIGHDDLLEPHYLGTMDRLINKHPNATLYQAHFNYIDSKGKLIRACKPMDEVQSASDFLSFFLCSMIDIMGTGFMMRSADYDDVGGIPPSYPNLLFADFELFINLTKKGYKATAYENAFSFRLHHSMTTTSSDMKFHAAFGKFIEYIVQLKQQDSQFESVINRYALDFLDYYSKGLSHRLLRTPGDKRNGKTVRSTLQLIKQYADMLVPGNSYEPEKQYSVRLARRIDDNTITRSLFLLFKKVRSKPVLK